MDRKTLTQTFRIDQESYDGHMFVHFSTQSESSIPIEMGSTVLSSVHDVLERKKGRAHNNGLLTH